jgi:hypothetical protein
MKTLIIMTLVFGMAQKSFGKPPCNSGDLQKDTLEIFEARNQLQLSDETVQYLINGSKRAKMSEIFACTVRCNRLISQQEHQFVLQAMQERDQLETAELQEKLQKYVQHLQNPNLVASEREIYEWAVSDVPKQIQELKNRTRELSRNVNMCTR